MAHDTAGSVSFLFLTVCVSSRGGTWSSPERCYNRSGVGSQLRNPKLGKPQSFIIGPPAILHHLCPEQDTIFTRLDSEEIHPPTQKTALYLPPKPVHCKMSSKACSENENHPWLFYKMHENTADLPSPGSHLQASSGRQKAPA